MHVAVEAMFRSAEGDRFDLRLAFRGPGQVARDRIETLQLRLAGKHRGFVGGPDEGCRVVLARASAAEVAGTARYERPSVGAPVAVTFRARR